MDETVKEELQENQPNAARLYEYLRALNAGEGKLMELQPTSEEYEATK